MKQRTALLHKTLSLLFIAVLFGGCTSFNYLKEAEQNEDKNDYFYAAYYLVKAVYWNERNKLAQDKLVIMYPRAIEEEEKKAARLTAQDPVDWELVVKCYERLRRLQRVVRNVQHIEHYATGKLLTFEEKEYDTLYEHACEQAAEFHYQRGINLAAGEGGEDGEDEENLKEALKAFDISMNYYEEYKDSRERYDEVAARLVEKHPEKYFTDSFPSVLIAIDNSKKDRYVDLDEKTYLPGIFFLENPHMDREKIFFKEEKKTVSEEIKERLPEKMLLVTIHSVTPDYPPVTVKSYYETRKVEGVDPDPMTLVTTYDLQASITLHYSLKYYDFGSGDLLDSRLTQKTNDFSARWAEYSGDERALSEKTKELVRNPQGVSPASDELYKELLKELSAEMADFIIKNSE